MLHRQWIQERKICPAHPACGSLSLFVHCPWMTGYKMTPRYVFIWVWGPWHHPEHRLAVACSCAPLRQHLTPARGPLICSSSSQPLVTPPALSACCEMRSEVDLLCGGGGGGGGGGGTGLLTDASRFWATVRPCPRPDAAHAYWAKLSAAPHSGCPAERRGHLPRRRLWTDASQEAACFQGLYVRFSGGAVRAPPPPFLQNQRYHVD